MAKYVDGFVVPVPKKKLQAYRSMAQKAGRIEVARTYLQKVIAAAPQSSEALQARKFLVMWE